MNITATLAAIRSALQRRGTSAQDAEDLVHEAWLKFASYEREHVVAQPEAFMMRAALNLAIDVHRTRTNHGEEVQVEDVILLDLSPTTEEQVLARERTTRLSLGLARLSGKARDIFLSHRIDGLTYQEIARRHDLSVSTVEKHIAKATAQLTAWMEGW